MLNLKNQAMLLVQTFFVHNSRNSIFSDKQFFKMLAKNNITKHFQRNITINFPRNLKTVSAILGWFFCCFFQILQINHFFLKKSGCHFYSFTIPLICWKNCKKTKTILRCVMNIPTYQREFQGPFL